MALLPTGGAPLSLDWDCSSALEALLAEDTADGGTSPTELRAGGGGLGGENSSPIYSPFSDVGSTQSGDSGYGAPLATEEDQLLAGLFGPDCPLLCEPTTSTASLSQSSSTSFSPPYLSGGSPRSPDSGSGQKVATSTVLVPVEQNHQQNAMFEFSDCFNLDSPSPPPPPTMKSDAKKTESHDQLEKSRKNAEAARQNRLKKKKYMEDLEKDRARLKAENVVVKTRCVELQNKYMKLETEVAYLKSVLANQSTLATLIKNIPGTPGVNLTSSLSHKRPREKYESLAETIPPPSKRPKNSNTESRRVTHSGGVCLHVSKESVSLEFCSQCSSKAAQV